MQYTNVTNPQWANAEHTVIDCVVDFVSAGQALFAANPQDTANTASREIFDRCAAGDFGPVADYEPPVQPTTEQMTAGVRARRNALLTESDWTQLPDVSQATKDLWAAYRQALRDITAQAGFPTDVEWPVAPN